MRVGGDLQVASSWELSRGSPDFADSQAGDREEDGKLAVLANAMRAKGAAFWGGFFSQQPLPLRQGRRSLQEARPNIRANCAFSTA